MKKRRSGFKYQKRTAKDVKDQAENSGSSFDSFLKPGVKQFKPPEGDNTIRILPATWENAKHWGLQIHIHYNVGGRNSYLCREAHKKGKCAICAEHRRASRKLEPGNKKQEAYVKSLRPSSKVLFYMIDRNRPKDGPLAWTIGWETNQTLGVQSYNKRSKSALFIEDPDEGNDVDFVRKGQQLMTRYKAWQVAHDSSPLSKKQSRADEWLAYIAENPLDEKLKFYSEEHIAEVFGGQRDNDEDDEDEDDDDEDDRRSRHSDDDDDDDKPRKKKRKKDQDDDEDEDEDEDEDDEDSDDDDDEDERPRRKGKKKKKKPSDDDDDDDEDDDGDDEDDEDEDEDDDEDDRPSRKSKKKKRRRDEDEDEDEDDDSDDDDD